MSIGAMVPAKAADMDLLARFREVISDPLNLLIERVPQAGVVEGNEVYLHNGNRVPVSGTGAYCGTFSQLLVVNRGVHEPLEEYVFQEVLKSLPASPQMIELGANWAHYSMWLKQKRSKARAIMVEPDLNFLSVGRANFARNGYDGEFIQAAVARGRWELDPFLKSRKISRIDILHVDIDGCEGELMEGARDSLGRALVDYLFVSTHSQALHQRITSGLAGHGYRVEVSSDFENDTTSFDGFVFAASRQAKPIFREFLPLGRTRIATSRADDIVEAVLKARQSRLAADPEGLDAGVGDEESPAAAVITAQERRGLPPADKAQFLDQAHRNRGAGGRPAAGPSRNAPCPCGSGKKYKRCCGADA